MAVDFASSIKTVRQTLSVRVCLTILRSVEWWALAAPEAAAEGATAVLEGFEARWQREVAEILAGVKEWRLAHPKATFAEIEAALDARWLAARAGLLRDMALASRAADGGAGALPGVRDGVGAAGKARTVGGDDRRRGRAVGAGVRRVPVLRGGSFSPWMRNWRCCPAG